jgi:hypothetical protein
MINQPQTFVFSEDFLDRLRRRMLVRAAIICAGMILFGSLIATDLKLEMTNVATFGVIIIIFILVLIIFISALFGQRGFIRRYRQMKLRLGATGLVREVGARRQEVAWDSITKVRIRQNPRGEPVAVEVFTASGRPMLLFFEPLAEIVRLVQARLPSTARVETKRARLDWENPIVMVSSAVVFSIVFVLLFKVVGRDVFSIVINLATGIGFLAYHPLSRTEPNYRKLDVVSGVCVLLSGLVRLCIKVVEWI